MAISCDLRLEFMRREAKNCVIGLEGNNSIITFLVSMLVFTGNQVCKFSGGRIIATGGGGGG